MGKGLRIRFLTIEGGGREIAEKKEKKEKEREKEKKKKKGRRKRKLKFFGKFKLSF